jgi:valyl-tRNA synthetase
LCDWYLELIKPRLRDGARAATARQVLAVLIDQVLRLLHPFIPYITEALWEPLNAQAPVRGIEAPLPNHELLILAVWPTTQATWRDIALEERMAFMQEVIRALRDIRSKYTIPPNAKVAARIRASNEVATALRSWSELLRTMANLESLEISPEVQRAPDAATAVVGQVEIYVPGIVDTVKEKTRLAKQREQLLSRINGSQRKLSNADFLQKASPDVVQKERDRLAEYEAEMENVEATLAALA